MNKFLGEKDNSALYIIFLTVFIDMLGFGIVIPVLPAWTLQFSKEFTQGSVPAFIIASVFSFMQFVFSPFWGNLSDKKGRKPIIMLTLIIALLGYFIFALATSFWLLVISRILAGIGAGNFSAAQAYIADITPENKRAEKLGLIGVAFGLGFIIGPFIGGELKANWGVQSIGYIGALLCFINLYVVYEFLPESNKNKSVNPLNSLSMLFTNIAKITSNKIIARVFVIFVTFTIAFSMMQITSAVLWAKVYKLSERQIGYIFSFIGICTVLVQGLLIKKFTKFFGVRYMLVLGSLIMCLVLWALPFAPFQRNLFYLVECILLAIIAFSNGMIMPASTSIVSSRSLPTDQGLALGTMMSLGALARGIGPFLSGFLYDIHHTLPFILGSFIMILALLLSLNLARLLKIK